jgi:hypothetical protein
LRRPGPGADFTTGEAVAAITRITNGNFRLTGPLIAQIQRILDIYHLSVVTSEVVDAARESLVIGGLCDGLSYRLRIQVRIRRSTR